MDRRLLLATPAPIPSNPGFDPSTYIDFANLTIAVAMAAITVITFALAVVAVLGSARCSVGSPALAGSR